MAPDTTHEELHQWLRQIRHIPALPPSGMQWCATCERILRELRQEREIKGHAQQ